jgi:hypothetical protein
VASVLADTHKVGAKSIQRILRHQRVTTTERYIGNVADDMKATLKLLEEEESKKTETVLHMAFTREQKERGNQNG